MTEPFYTVTGFDPLTVGANMDAELASESTRADAAIAAARAAAAADATAKVATETTRATTAEALLAPKASPALTGTPMAPTAAAGTNTTQLATTAFVARDYATMLTRVPRTSAYAAAVGDLVVCDTTAGTFTVTLPAASVGRGRVAIKWVAGTIAPTVALSVSNHVNTSTGATTFSPTLLNQGYVLDSDGTSIWTVTADDLPLSQLDLRYAAKGDLVFNVKDYGAVGNGTSTAAADTAAFQAAATAAIAVSGTLVIPKPATFYSITSTIQLVPAGALTQFNLNIIGPAAYDAIRWGGAVGGAVFYVRGWKRSSVRDVHIRFTANGGIGWDLDGDGTFNSLGSIGWYDCTVDTGIDVPVTGVRIGHSDPTGACDFSFLEFHSCGFSGVQGATSTQIGILDEGGNSLNHSWFGGFCFRATTFYTNRASAGAVGNGNASKFFYGVGMSRNQLDYDLVSAGAYVINGGRYEAGKRLLNVDLGGGQGGANVTMYGGWEIVAYAPADGIMFRVDAGSTFLLESGKIRPSTVTGTGTTTNGSNAVASVTGTFAVGQTVVGPGIPARTTITAVGTGTLTLSANAGSGAGTGTLTAAADYTSALVTLTGSAATKGYFRCKGVQMQTTPQFYTLPTSPSWTVEVAGVQYLDTVQHGGTSWHVGYGASPDNRFHPGAIGQWYINPLALNDRTLAQTLNAVEAYLCWSGAEGVTIDAFDVNVSVAGTASLCRVGVYLVNDQNRPFKWATSTAWATLLAEAGTVATTATGQQTLTAGTPVVVPPNQWFAVAGVEQGTAAATRWVGGSSGAASFSGFGTAAAGGYNTGGPGLSLVQTGVSGALPSTLTPNLARPLNSDNGVGFRRSA